MDPLTIAAIMGGAGGLNEMTSGREQQKRDAVLKATAYRVSPYMKINPEDFQVHQADPMGAAIQGGMSGYKLGSDMAADKAWKNYVAAKGAAHGGLASAQEDMEEFSGNRSPAIDPGTPRRSPYRLLSEDLHGGLDNDLMMRYRMKG